MNITPVERFYMIGIAVRTTNENGQSATDIPKLWDEFFSKDIVDSIPDKADQAVYCVYTDYEGDHTKPYTTVLGCRVNNLNTIPEGFKGISIDSGGYAKFTAKGELADQIVFREWTKIWESDLPRSYQADFEVYGNRAWNPDMAEVDIFIGMK